MTFIAILPTKAEAEEFSETRIKPAPPFTGDRSSPALREFLTVDNWSSRPFTPPAPLLTDDQIRHALDDGACVYYRDPGSGRLLPVDRGYIRDSLAGKSRQRINLTQNAEGDLIFAGFEDRE